MQEASPYLRSSMSMSSGSKDFWLMSEACRSASADSGSNDFSDMKPIISGSKDFWLESDLASGSKASGSNDFSLIWTRSSGSKERSDKSASEHARLESRSGSKDFSLISFTTIRSGSKETSLATEDA